jgi:ubiquitin C-terminal hydrolase
MKNMTPCPYQGQNKLSLKRFFASESEDESKSWEYELRGVSDHHGTHRGGHYTAQMKHPITGDWWWMDDERAQKKEGPLYNASNYIFYFRRTA